MVANLYLLRTQSVLLPDLTAGMRPSYRANLRPISVISAGTAEITGPALTLDELAYGA